MRRVRKVSGRDVGVRIAVLVLVVVATPCAAVACGGSGSDRDASVADGTPEVSPGDRTSHHPRDTGSPHADAAMDGLPFVDAEPEGSGEGAPDGFFGEVGAEPESFADAGVLDASIPEAALDVYPAAHTPMPVILNHGGPTISAPNLVPVFYAGDPNQTALVTFLSELGTSSYWGAATSEYGIGPATIGTPIVVTTPPPKSVSDAEIQALVLANTTGAEPAWGARSPYDLYVLYLPATTTLTFCFGCAYHGSTGSAGDAGDGAVYAVMAEKNFPSFTDLTRLTTHEIVEIATDPYGATWFGTDANDTAWEVSVLFPFPAPIQIDSQELGDMCELYLSSAYTPPDLPFQVQRIWSNASAAASHDPCVPIPAGEVYFNSAVVPTDNVVIEGGTVVTHGVKIGLGKSRTVEVDLYSDAPTSGPWTLSAAATVGKLDFSFDKTTGQNGDRVHLTITAVAQDPSLTAEAFTITSTLGTMTTYWYGVVGN